MNKQTKIVSSKGKAELSSSEQELLDGLADLTTRGELITIRIIPVFGSKD